MGIHSILHHFHFTQLHQPADPGIDRFWVDFNLSSQTLAMFVEDPYARGGANPEDSMWEYVVIRRSVLKHWMVEGTYSI